MSTPPASPLLSPSQLSALAELGEERSAPVGELLYQVGDRTYPFIAILEGEVAIVDAAGNELVRHGPSGSRRAESSVRADGLRQRARDRAAAVHRGRARRTALAPQRGRPAQRPRPLHLHLPARGAAERARDRPGDRRPARARSRRCECSTSRARTGFRTRGTMPPRPAAARCRSCGCPAEESCTVRPRARCCARSGSGSSSRPARRSTC